MNERVRQTLYGTQKNTSKVKSSKSTHIRRTSCWRKREPFAPGGHLCGSLGAREYGRLGRASCYVGTRFFSSRWGWCYCRAKPSCLLSIVLVSPSWLLRSVGRSKSFRLTDMMSLRWNERTKPHDHMAQFVESHLPRIERMNLLCGLSLYLTEGMPHELDNMDPENQSFRVPFPASL